MAKASNGALIADIGGTNARFALVDPGTPAPALAHQRVYRTADFPSLQEALDAYFAESAPKVRPQAAVLAVAGPVRGDRIELMNRAWSFSVSALKERFGFAPLIVLNDFAAIAHSLPHLNPGDLRRIGGPPTEEAGALPVLAVVGPGTGLGVAGLLRAAGGDHVIASEGGHADFAPADATEIEIRQILQARFGHVSYERLLAGPGLTNLHAALAQMEGASAEARDPADIVRAALAGSDPLCAAALERYCAILGGFAGDVALMFGASRLFLGGGIVPRFPDFLERSGFRARFEAKGRFAALLRSVPVDVILHKAPGLLGAAMALRAQLQRESGG